jgi:hypothetical protein
MSRPSLINNAANGPEALGGNELVENEDQALRDLRHFKAIHGIKRSASYPAPIIVQSSVIALFGLLHMGAIVFLLRSSRLELANQVGLAVLITVLNSVVGVASGYVPCRYLNHVDQWKRVLSGAVLFVIALLVPSFHLASAHFHYHDAMMTPQNVWLGSLLETMWKSPLRLGFQSLMILVVGLISFLIALYLGYRADDPYPGFTALQRRYESARRAREAAGLQAAHGPSGMRSS